MNVLFVYSLDPTSGVFSASTAGVLSCDGISFGLSYLMAAAQRAGHTCRLLVLVSADVPLSELLVDQCLAEEGLPDVIAYTAVSSEYPFIRTMAAGLAARAPRARHIIGGTHVTLQPEGVLDAPSPFHALCVGEGEAPLVEWLDALAGKGNPDAIRNLWTVSRDGTLIRNPTRPFLQNLDELPDPERELWEPWISARSYSAQVILVGRGCGYDCSYCSNHAIRKTASGCYVRFRSPARIIDEIKAVLKRHPATPRLFLEAEALTLNKPWLLDLCDHLATYNREAGHGLPYGANFRIAKTSLSDDVFAALDRANIRTLNIGLEAGSERIRREILNRPYSNDDFLRAVELARKYHIDFNIFNMIGLPTETPEDHAETIRLNRLARPRYSFTSIFYPYPGTHLYHRCQQMGLLNRPIDTRRERRIAALDMPQFSRRQIRRAYILFDHRIFRHEQSWRQRIGRIFYAYTGCSTLREFLYLHLAPRRIKLRRMKRPPR